MRVCKGNAISSLFFPSFLFIIIIFCRYKSRNNQRVMASRSTIVGKKKRTDRLIFPILRPLPLRSTPIGIIPENVRGPQCLYVLAPHTSRSYLLPRSVKGQTTCFSCYYENHTSPTLSSSPWQSSLWAAVEYFWI